MENGRLKKWSCGHSLFLSFIILAAGVINAKDTPVQGVGDGTMTMAQQRLQKKISVDFKDTPIDDVLRAMATQAEIDIVKSPAVMGTVTATLTDIPLGEALDNILAVQGYGYVTTENMIRILPRKDIVDVREEIVNRIFHIKYADVKSVEMALQKFISKEGSISSNVGTSNLIVTDTKSRIVAIENFINDIDRKTPQILVEVRIYDISHHDTLDLGVQWQAGTNTTLSRESLTNPVGTNATAGNTTPFGIGTFDAATSKTSDTTGSLRLGWLSGNTDIDAIIKAQAEGTTAKLLANPRLLVLDNEVADFNIVREIPYTETTTGGNLATETIRFKDVGVSLKVRPHVTDINEGLLRLNINPQFSVIVSQDLVTKVPTVDRRAVNTITLVKDGYTVVLGGLRKKDVVKQTNKIPLLGDLPLLGPLFRFEGEDTLTSEIIVFITPRIIDTPVMTAVEQEGYNSTNFPLLGPKDTRAEKKAAETQP